MHADIAERRDRKSEAVGEHARTLRIGCAVGVVCPCERNRKPVGHQSREPLRRLEHALARNAGRRQDAEDAFAPEPTRAERLDEVMERKAMTPLLGPRHAGTAARRRLVAPGTVRLGFRGRNNSPRCPRLGEQAAERTPRGAVAWIEQEIDRLASHGSGDAVGRARPWRIGDREPHAGSVREPHARSSVRATLLADDRLACGDMRPDGAAEGLEVGQRDSGVTEARRLADQFLGMAGSAEEGVVAGDRKLAPAWPSEPPHGAREGWRCLMADIRAACRRRCRLAQRMLPELGWRFVGHRATPMLQESR